MEVSMLMNLFVEMLRKELNNLNENNVRLQVIGNIEQLPKKTRSVLLEGIEFLKENSGLTLVLAFNYGGRDDIVQAARAFARKACADPTCIETLDEKIFSQFLYTKEIPDPELIVRTSGECRISNFLIWQAAYAELYITDVLWPDFDKEALVAAIEEYNRRDRRFGKVHDS
jgi:undecaprenyl diphosphate synthase